MENFYCIVTSCDPYHASAVYHGDPVVKYDGITPIAWISHSFLEFDEALDILQGIASEHELDIPSRTTMFTHDIFSYAIYQLNVTPSF